MAVSDEIIAVGRQLLLGFVDLYANNNDFRSFKFKVKLINETVTPDKIAENDSIEMKRLLRDMLANMEQSKEILQRYEKHAKRFNPFQRSQKYNDEKEIIRMTEKLDENLTEFDVLTQQKILESLSIATNIRQTTTPPPHSQSHEITLDEIGNVDLNVGGVIRTKYAGSPVVVQFYGSYKNHAIRDDIFKEISYLHTIGEHKNFIKCYGRVVHENNIYTVKEDVGNEDKTLYMAMKSYNNTEKKKILLQIISAVELLNQHDIVLKTLNSKNILISTEMTPKITELSNSKHITHPTTMISHEFISDGIKWQAPETANPAATSSFKADVYSIGMILWEMLSGKPLYDGMTKREIYHAKVSEERTRELFDLNEYPFVIRCVHVDPEQRLSLTELSRYIASSF